jgi:hypothetical protein
MTPEDGEIFGFLAEDLENACIDDSADNMTTLIGDVRTSGIFFRRAMYELKTKTPPIGCNVVSAVNRETAPPWLMPPTMIRA